MPGYTATTIISKLALCSSEEKSHFAKLKSTLVTSGERTLKDRIVEEAASRSEPFAGHKDEEAAYSRGQNDEHKK